MEVNDLHTENHKTRMKEIENTNRYQSSIEFFTEIEKNNSNLYMEKKDPN
jgi:hypothetical protein